MTQPQLRAAVTGASRGIGRATVLELARHGFLVFGLARSKDGLDGLASEAAHEDLHVTPVAMDIADTESRQQAIEAVTSATEGYGVDVLVNNAGYGHFGPLEEVSEEELLRQFQVNVFGLHAVTRAFLPGMRERQRGWIVNVSSVSGRLAMPFNGPYAATKFALEAMSDAMRLELHPFGVHVILIEPGPIPTDFWRAAKGGEMDPTSPYARFTGRWRGTSGFVTGLLDRSPETVARVIRRAVQSDHPRARYTITVHAKVGSAARRLVPDFLMDMVIRLAMGLRRQ